MTCRNESNNVPMEFDQLVDELEASFAQQNFDWKQNINLLTIQTIEGHFVDLLAPIIGLDFVAGLDQQNADWLCYSNACIANLKPRTNPDRELPLLRHQEIRIAQFMSTLELPMRVTVKYLNQSEAAFNIFGVDSQYLIADDKQLIPLQSIYQFRMLGTNSWQ